MGLISVTGILTSLPQKHTSVCWTKLRLPSMVRKQMFAILGQIIHLSRRNRRIECFVLIPWHLT
jgi:hypothetical protein